MNRWYNKLSFVTRRYETFLFTGLLCWLSVYAVLQWKTPTWPAYLSTLLVLVLLQLPVLLFSWNREWLKTILSPRRYLLTWLACFVVYAGVQFMIASTLLSTGSLLQTIIPMTTVSVFFLELLLTANNYYQKRLQQLTWLKKLSLERSVLISIVLISVVLSLMAVSSIGNPSYDNEERLLIGFEFNVKKILSQFGLFLLYSIQFLFIYLCGYFFFFINNRVLVPKILRTKGVVIYSLSVLASVSILYPVVAQLLEWLPLNKRMGGIFPDNIFELENAFGATGIIVLSLPVVLAIQWSRQNNQIISLEKEKTQTELDLLKQQLNPHFFFNTLNNLYALSLKQSKETPESILRLSELMRYVIYKAKEPTVNIREEVKYLEDYIQLQQIRLQRKPDIRFSKEMAGDTPPIAPLLLIVLVENAFKHGIEPAEEESFLHLSLTTTGNRLLFSCVNSVEQDVNEGTGIGIANLQRRLTLLYPGKHLLKIGMENHTFSAQLELDLS